jgi:ubiquinone/menaquinone biosynthesis C-methylase UbiE
VHADDTFPDAPSDALDYYRRYRNDELFKYVSYRRGVTVLDGSCGQGLLLRQLEPCACTVWGIDRSLATLFLTPKPRQVAAARIDQLPFADEAFDAILYQDLSRTVADPGHVIGEMARLLCPGGRIVLWESQRALCDRETDFLGRYIRAAGLVPLCTEPFDYLAYPAAILTGAIPLFRSIRLAHLIVQVTFGVDALLKRLPAPGKWSWHLIYVAEKPYA